MSDWVTQTVRENQDEPAAEVVIGLLDAAAAEENLRALVDESIATSRVWSLRVAAIALVRALKPDYSGESPTDLAALVFRLSRAALDCGRDDWAFGTVLTALQWLVWTDRPRGRDATERRVSTELLWRSLVAQHPNTRSAAINALEVIHDFGDLAELLGEGGVQELRRRIGEAKSGAAADVEQDLASAELLVR